MEEKRITCITCPLGCDLIVRKDKDVITVEGNTCKRGELFGKEEMIEPKRMLTTTMVTVGKVHTLIPVVSSTTIPKKELFKVLQVIQKETVKTPIKKDDVIIKNILNTGADIVASKSIE